MCFLGGCGSREDEWTRKRPKVYKAGGVVLQEGKPVTEAIVTFQPVDGQYSGTGYTDEEGRFQLTTFEDYDGVVEGDFQVTVEKIKWVPISANELEAALPDGPEGGGNFDGPVKRVLLSAEKYGDFEKSGLTAKVTPDGPNEFTFDLDPPSK